MAAGDDTHPLPLVNLSMDGWRRNEGCAQCIHTPHLFSTAHKIWCKRRKVAGVLWSFVARSPIKEKRKFRRFANRHYRVCVSFCVAHRNENQWGLGAGARNKLRERLNIKTNHKICKPAERDLRRQYFCSLLYSTTWNIYDRYRISLDTSR